MLSLPLGGDIATGEDEDIIRNEAILQAQLSCVQRSKEIFQSVQDPTNGWQLVTEQSDVKVYKRVIPGKPMPMTMGIAYIDAPPLVILRYICDLESYVVPNTCISVSGA